MINSVVKGDLITLALGGEFDAIAHGCNCFCTQKAGIARVMAKTFSTDTFVQEQPKYKGSIYKLGNIDYASYTLDVKANEYILSQYNGTIKSKDYSLYVINLYTQYMWATEFSKLPVNYAAIELCFTKLNILFKDFHIGIPRIGAGLAGGDWSTIYDIIDRVTPKLNITVVEL